MKKSHIQLRYQQVLFRTFLAQKRFRESAACQIQQVNRSFYWMLMFQEGSYLEKIIILLHWFNLGRISDLYYY